MQEELTVRVEHPELPAIRWNEAEVQQNLTEMLAAYTGRVYTPETIKDAKADRAAVNKLDKQLSGCCPQCKGLLHEAAGRVLAERQADAGPV